jgi:hypothetical protein
MRPRIIYHARIANQISLISEQEADVRLRLGAVPIWDTPIVDLSSSEIIFKCILNPQEEKNIVR